MSFQILSILTIFSLKINSDLIKCISTTLSPASTPCLHHIFPPDTHSIPFASVQKILGPQETTTKLKKKKSSYNKIRQKSSYRGWTRKSSRRKTVSIASKRIRDTHFPIVRNFMKAPSQ